MRLLFLVSVLVAVVGGFAVTFTLSLFVEEPALNLRALVDLVLVLLLLGLGLVFVVTVIKYRNSSGTVTKYKRVLPPLKDEKPLDTRDLNKIITLLEKHQYSGKSYDRLGLSLGLSHRTLEVIEFDNNNSLERCLREVLAKWLDKADNVKKPTWSALVAALRRINRNAVAEGIDRETDPVSMIIENHRHDLSQSIPENQLTYIARLLSYELDIKSLESLHGPTSEKIEVLLTTVKNAVYENYENILKFAGVLCTFAALRSIGNTIQKDYSKAIVDNNFEIKIMGRNEDPIKVPLNFSLECKEMRTKWAIAVHSAIKAITNVEVQELKGFLQILTSNSDIKEKLNACQSKGDIMQIITDHCSLVDLTLLEGIIECFKNERAKEYINDYKDIKDDFCKKIPLRLLLNETIGCPSSLQCETLHFSVDESVDKRTLNDVQDLTKIAFESNSPYVRVVVVKEGNSFIITCSFPLALSESLIATALKNIERLKKEGLIKLTIGYSTVYSQDEVKVVAVKKFKKIILKILSPITSTFSTKREKSQHIASVYNSSGTMKQLLVSLNIQLINCEASSNEERKMFQGLFAEKIALVKKVETEGDTRIQELKLMIEEKQDEIRALQFSLSNLTELNEVMKTQLKISRAKDQEIEDWKAAAARNIAEKAALVKKIENEGDTRIQELKLMIEEKQDEIKALQFSLRNATKRENIAAEDNKALNERIEAQLRISRTKDQEIEDLKAAAIREKIEMTKTKKDNELQIEALKTAIKENEEIIEQSQIKDLSIIIREKDKAIAELQQLIMGDTVNEFKQKMKHDLEASSDLESQIKYLNIIISEKDKTIAELQHLDKMAHLEESSDSDNSPQLRWGPNEILEDNNKGFIKITNPSLKACQYVITKLRIDKNFLYPLLINLSPGATRLLIPALLNARNVQRLTIRNTSLTSDFILSLSSQLSSNSSIWDLNFNDDTIDDDGVIALVHLLKDNTRVIELSISYNSGITSASVQPLKELILTNKKLQTLCLTDTNIDTDGVLSLIETLQTNKRINIWLSRRHEQACSSLPYYDTIKERLAFF